MANRRMQVARQQELNFLGHQQKRSGEDGDNCTDQDDGSIDLSQEFAPGCFSATLKRNFKALCGRLGRWSHAPKKPSSLYRYLHINVPHHDPFFFQRQKSKSRQSLLHHPVVFKEHAYISTHEEVKDIHLDPQFIGECVKDQARLTSYDQHPHPYEDESLYNKMSTVGRHNTSPLLGAKPNAVKSFEQHGAIALTSHRGSQRQTEVLTSIHELMRGVDHGLQPQATPLHPTTNVERSTPSRPSHANPTMQSVKSKPFSVQDNDDTIIRSTSEREIMPNKVHNVDNYLSSLAAHVFSLRSQVMKGGFGSVYDPEREATGINHSNSDASIKDVKKTIASLISTRKFEDLADLEEFLQCYMRLYSPCFLNMVDDFFCEISNDIFECEAWFDNPDTHTF